MQKIKLFMFISIFIIFSTAVQLSAQSAEIVDNLLSSDEAGFGDAVYMIAVGSGISDKTVSVSDAVSVISERGWNVGNKEAGDPISLGELSFIIMQAFDMEGGIMYMLLPSARYAVRELAYKQVISDNAHPDRNPDGEEVLRIITGVIDLKEAE